LLLCLQCRIYR